MVKVYFGKLLIRPIIATAIPSKDPVKVSHGF